MRNILINKSIISINKQILKLFKIIEINKLVLRTTFCLMIGYIGYYLCRNNLATAFPLLCQKFLFTNAELGLIGFYSELSYAFGKLINGPIVDRSNGKQFFLIGMIGAILFNFIFTLGTNLTFFIIIWCIVRYFISIGWMSLASICSKLYDSKNYGSAMGVLSISFQLGGAISTLFCAFLISNKVGWKALFLYPGIILFIIFCICITLIKEHNSTILTKKIATSTKPTIKELKILFFRKSFIYLLNYSFFITSLRAIFLIWIPKMFVDLGFAFVNAIIDSSGFLFLGIISTLFLGFYTDKMAYKNNRSKIIGYMLLGLLICTTTIWYLITYTLNIKLLPYLISLCGFFLLGPYSIAGGAMCLDVGKEKFASTCTGYVDGIGYIGGAITVYIIGIIIDTYNWSTVMIAVSILTIINISSAFLLSNSLKKEQKN